jgi:hypothetical protein
VSLGALRPNPPSNTPGALPPKPYDTVVTQISDDGSTVVGYEDSSGRIWHEATGMQPIPRLPNQSSMFLPLGVSGDGSVVVGGIGGATGINSFSGPGAVVWDADHGTRLLKDVLVEVYGLGDLLRDKFLEHATYISPDGKTVAGRYDRSAGGGSWVVTLPWWLAVPEPGAMGLMMEGLVAVAALRRSRG